MFDVHQDKTGAVAGHCATRVLSTNHRMTSTARLEQPIARIFLRVPRRSRSECGAPIHLDHVGQDDPTSAMNVRLRPTTTARAPKVRVR